MSTVGIEERHKFSLEYFDIEVLVYENGDVSVEISNPNGAVEEITLTVRELDEIVRFVEKHGEVTIGER